MGGSQSSQTPLDCMKKHMKEFFEEACDGFNPSLLDIFCRREWTAFNVGWPETGSLDPDLVKAVLQCVADPPYHPKQYPYISAWWNLVTQDPPPPWLKRCKEEQCRILLARGKPLQKPKKKPIYRSPDADDGPPPYQASGTEAATAPRLSNQEEAPVVVPTAPPTTTTASVSTTVTTVPASTSSAATTLSAASQPVVTPTTTVSAGIPMTVPRLPASLAPPQNAPADIITPVYPSSDVTICPPQPASETLTPPYDSGSRLVNQAFSAPAGGIASPMQCLDASGGLSHNTPSLLDQMKTATRRLDFRRSPYDLRLRDAFQAPLRETRGPNIIDEQGNPQPGQRVFVYVPFTTTDLLNWKTHNPSFTEKPQAMTDLMQSIIQTHHPTWADCQQLFLTLFNIEERRRITQGALKWLEEQANQQGQANPRQWAEQQFPTEDPHWDPNEAVGLTSLELFRRALIQGMREGSRKALNMSKTSEVLQKPDESPSQFYDRLCDAFRLYTPFDPAAADNQRMVNSAFVAQAQGDIKRKLQKLEGFAGMNISQLIEVATKVFVNRDQEAKRETDRKLKKKADLLAAALTQQRYESRQKRGRGKNNRPPTEPRSPLGPDQCRLCKDFGHWADSCPLKRRPSNRGRGASRPGNPVRGRGRVVGGRYERQIENPYPDEDEFIGMAALEEYSEDYED